jgi:hypothetical protein
MNAAEPQPQWDDWQDRRDGMRGYLDPTHRRHKHLWAGPFSDQQEIEKANERIKHELEIRKARKLKELQKKNVENFTTMGRKSRRRFKTFDFKNRKRK